MSRDGTSEALRDGERLGRCERLRRSADFQRVQRRGRREVGPHVVLIAREGKQPWTRIGLTVSRKVGKAVTRNLVKRRLREIFRRERALFPAGHDVVIIARHAAATASYETLRAELSGLCQRLTRRQRPRRRGG